MEKIKVEKFINNGYAKITVLQKILLKPYY